MVHTLGQFLIECCWSWIWIWSSIRNQNFLTNLSLTALLTVAGGASPPFLCSLSSLLSVPVSQSVWKLSNSPDLRFYPFSANPKLLLHLTHYWPKQPARHITMHRWTQTEVPKTKVAIISNNYKCVFEFFLKFPRSGHQSPLGLITGQCTSDNVADFWYLLLLSFHCKLSGKRLVYKWLTYNRSRFTINPFESSNYKVRMTASGTLCSGLPSMSSKKTLNHIVCSLTRHQKRKSEMLWQVAELQLAEPRFRLLWRLTPTGRSPPRRRRRRRSPPAPSSTSPSVTSNSQPHHSKERSPELYFLTRKYSMGWECSESKW